MRLPQPLSLLGLSLALLLLACASPLVRADSATTVSFEMTYSLQALPGGSVAMFGTYMQGEVGYALSCPDERIQVGTVAAAASSGILVQMAFLPAETGPSTYTLATQFVSQVATPSSPLFTRQTASATKPNSAHIAGGGGAPATDDGGGGSVITNKVAGGVPLWGALIIILFALIFLGLGMCWCIKCCKRKQLRIDQRMMGRDTGTLNTELGHI